MAQVQYTKSVIADISGTYTVDPRRIYISGKSNGGGFTALAACHPELSTLFAAFSPVSPALYPLTGAFGGLLCNPGRVVPVLHSHGVEDTDTPFHGRRPGECGYGPEPDVRDWRRDWAARNEENESRADRTGAWARGEDERAVGAGVVVDEPFEDVTRTTWSGNGWEVVGLTIEKLGHAWPSTEGLDLAGYPNQTATFNFTSEVLIPFFDRHVLPEEYVRRA
jgi:poly(3-hydroxybutyrate) depolymerase